MRQRDCTVDWSVRLRTHRNIYEAMVVEVQNIRDKTAVSIDYSYKQKHKQLSYWNHWKKYGYKKTQTPYALQLHYQDIKIRKIAISANSRCEI